MFRRDEHPRFFYVPFRDGTRMADTLEVPPYPMLTARRQASYRVSAGTGRLLDGLSYVPFAPVPVWDVTHAGTILSSSGAEYALIETGTNGDTLRVIRGPTADPAEIPGAEREDSARALALRLDSLPVPIDQVVGLGPGVRERRLPVTLPPIIGIHVATDSAIWVERWPPEGQSESRFYDVFDHDGELRRRVVLRAPLTREPPPFFGANYVTGVIREADTDVDRVVRFTLSAEPIPDDPPM
ncbi:MAG: hypothetical protein ACREM1_04025 [Longimicrobiales bacterium]